MKFQGLKLTMVAALMAGVAVSATAAVAEEASVLDGFSAYVAGTTDYRYRGISQNSTQFTPQGSINWAGDYGFYAGTWLSKVDWGGNDPSLEADWYIGKHTDLGGTDLNVEAYYYSYPEYRRNGGPVASYYETIAQLSHAFGPLTLTATGAWSPEWSLHAGEGWYGAGTASYAVSDWLSVSGTVGHQYVKNIPNEYTHWDLGATATWKSFTLDVRYVDNDIGNYCGLWMTTSHACDATVMATLTYNVAKLF
jgi:uncharacterized protein (TIGR02001 family)